MKTPDLRPKTMNLSIAYVNRLLGMNYTREQASELLERMRHGAKPDPKDGDGITVLIPAYRTDILHPMDLVEDIAIAYGYMNYKPEMPKIATVGMKDGLERFSGTVRELMIGSEFQEVMTLIMTSKESLFSRMNLKDGETVEAENPVSAEHSVARTNLLPSLISVLEKNRNREYPQRIFEVGDVILPDGKGRRKIAALIAHSKSNYSETKAVLAGLLESLGLKYGIKPYRHASFIEGRCAATEYGFFGEISPVVLEKFAIEVPVSGFELELDSMYAGKGV